MINNVDIELNEIEKIGAYFIEFTTNMPYDGCFWEYNYLLVIDNKIIDIHVTTKEPIKTVKDLKNYQNPENNWRNTGFITYDVIDGLNLNNFPYSYLQGFNELLQSEGINIGFTCSECHDFIENPEYIYNDSYTGNGGIGIEYTDCICGECYSLGTCSECGEYAGHWNLFLFNHHDMCEYCLEKALLDNGYLELDNVICDWLYIENIDLRTPLYNKLYSEYRYVYINIDTQQIYAYNSNDNTEMAILNIADILEDNLALLFYDGDNEGLQQAKLYATLKHDNHVLFTV